MPAAQTKIHLGEPPIALQGGRAFVTFTSKANDGRYRGWLCRPNGERLERLQVKYLSEADARGAVLVDKGKI